MWVSNIILLATKMIDMISDTNVNCQIFVIKLINFCAKSQVFYGSLWWHVEAISHIIHINMFIMTNS
jgi:hypothetical protein